MWEKVPAYFGSIGWKMQKEKLGDGSGYLFSSAESQMILMKDLGLTQQTASLDWLSNKATKKLWWKLSPKYHKSTKYKSLFLYTAQ